MDLLPEATRAAQLEKVRIIPFPDSYLVRMPKLSQLKKKLSRTLEKTRYVGAPIVAVSAQPGGADSGGVPFGLEDLTKVESPSN